MLKLYRTYLASSFILPLVASTLFFVVFLMTFQLLKFVQLMADSQMGLGFIAQMLLEMGVTMIPLALPISIYFSTIFCMNRLSADSELIALRSFGLTKWNILKPFLAISMVLAISAVFLTQSYIPRAHKSLRTKINMISSTSLMKGIKSGQFFTSIPNVTMFAEKVDERTRGLEEVFLQIYDTKKDQEQVIYAKAGKIIHEKALDTARETLKLVLYNGNIAIIEKGSEKIEKVLFGEYSLPVSSKSFSYKAKNKENMKSGFELKAMLDKGLDWAIKNGYKKKNYFKAEYEFFNRWNTSILILLFTFVGFTLGVKGARHHSKNSSAKAILVMIFYYALFFFLVGMSKSGKIPTFISLLLPTIIMLIYVVPLYKKLDWQS